MNPEDFTVGYYAEQKRIEADLKTKRIVHKAVCELYKLSQNDLRKVLWEAIKQDSIISGITVFQADKFINSVIEKTKAYGVLAED